MISESERRGETMEYCCVMMGDEVLGDYVTAALELAGIRCVREKPEEASVICCTEEGVPSVPEECGVVVLYRRARYTRTPAYAALSETHRCRALERPFLLEELIRAVLELMDSGERSFDAAAKEEEPVVLHREELSVQWGGQSIRLTEREFRLLEILCEKSGSTVSREVILHDAWDGLESRGNAVDVYIGYLRRKLEPVFGKGGILAVRGAGYVLNPEGKTIRIR